MRHLSGVWCSSQFIALGKLPGQNELTGVLFLVLKHSLVLYKFLIYTKKLCFYLSDAKKLLLFSFFSGEKGKSATLSQNVLDI